jgi:hypothetical protein
MRGLTPDERSELLGLDAPGERMFDDATIDLLLQQARIREYDFAPDGSYRIELTELGRLALRLWPLNRCA